MKKPELSRLNTIFVQSVKGGVGKTYIALGAVKELIKCKHYESKNCPYKRAVYIDLDFCGTSFVDSGYTLNGEQVEPLKWEIADKSTKEKPETLTNDDFISTLIGLYKYYVEETLSIKKFKLKSTKNSVLYISSGNPNTGDLTELILFDPIHAGWMAELLHGLMISLSKEWKDNALSSEDKECQKCKESDCDHKIYFVLDCPPGFSQLGPVLAEYMLKYNGMRYTKFCYVLSADRLDIKATINRIVPFKKQWDSINDVVHFVKNDKSIITEKNKNDIMKKNKDYFMELEHDGYKLEHGDYSFFGSALHVIVNKYSDIAAGNGMLNCLRCLYLQASEAKIKIDRIYYDELLSLAYTAYENSLSLEVDAEKPKIPDLLSWLQQADKDAALGKDKDPAGDQRSEASRREINITSSICVAILYHILILLRSIVLRRDKEKVVPVDSYLVTYVKSVMSSVINVPIVTSVNLAPIATLVTLAPEVALTKRIEGKNYEYVYIEVTKQLEGNTGIFSSDPSIEKCFRYYLEIILARLVLDEYVGLNEISDIIDYLIQVLGGALDNTLEYVADLEDARFFIKGITVDWIWRCLGMLRKVEEEEAKQMRQALGKPSPVISFLKTHLLAQHFPFNETQKVYNGKREPIITPAAINRMIESMESSWQ